MKPRARESKERVYKIPVLKDSKQDLPLAVNPSDFLKPINEAATKYTEGEAAWRDLSRYVGGQFYVTLDQSGPVPIKQVKQNILDELRRKASETVQKGWEEVGASIKTFYFELLQLDRSDETNQRIIDSLFKYFHQGAAATVAEQFFSNLTLPQPFGYDTKLELRVIKSSDGSVDSVQICQEVTPKDDKSTKVRSTCSVNRRGEVTLDNIEVCVGKADLLGLKKRIAAKEAAFAIPNQLHKIYKSHPGDHKSVTQLHETHKPPPHDHKQEVNNLLKLKRLHLDMPEEKLLLDSLLEKMAQLSRDSSLYPEQIKILSLYKDLMECSLKVVHENIANKIKFMNEKKPLLDSFLKEMLKLSKEPSFDLERIRQIFFLYQQLMVCNLSNQQDILKIFNSVSSVKPGSSSLQENPLAKRLATFLQAKYSALEPPSPKPESGSRVSPKK